MFISLALAVSQMTLAEKIGQLFIVPAVPDHGEEHQELLLNLLKTHHIGSVLLQKGTPETARTLLARVKQQPILCFGDAEWGVSMRLRDTVRFPRNLTLGAIQDLTLLTKFGHQVGWECRQVGIDINLAPVADVNTNPLNPVIGTRSFGDTPEDVAKKASLVIQGMMAEGTWGCLKHYPGHGDTAVDSHIGLPVIDTLQLLPFKTVKSPAIMTAHLYYRPLEEIVTFSRALVHDTLRTSWKFDGLIITDALNMGALKLPPEETAVRALKAGHDLLLFGDHRPDIVADLLQNVIPRAFAAIQKAVSCGEISEEEIDAHVERIMKAKKELCRPLPPSQDLRTPEAISLKRTLLREAVTLVSNVLLPLPKGTSFNVVQFGTGDKIFADSLARYGTLGDGVTIAAIYEATPQAEEFLAKLRESTVPYAVVLFCSPYKLLSLGMHPTTLVAFEDDPDAEEAAADVIFGELKPLGRLPVCL